MFRESDEFRLPGFLLGIIVAGIALFGDFVMVGALSRLALFDMPLILAIFSAWLSAGLGLVIVWLGVGGGPLYLRLLAVGIMDATYVLIVEGRWDVELFANNVLFLAAAAVPFGLMYFAGIELLHVETVQFPAGGGGAVIRRGQFSLRQLFGWTVGAALLASVARFASHVSGELMQNAIGSGALSLIAVGAACAALLPGRRATVVLSLAILSASAVLLTCGAALLFFRRRLDSAELAYFAFGSLVHVFLVSVVLLLYRLLGYRLRRRQPPSASRVP